MIASGSAAAFPHCAFASAQPNLRFGVASDIHIGGKKDAEATTERVLRWFASQNVDAVLCPGDIAHSGLIDELEKFAAIHDGFCRLHGRRFSVFETMEKIIAFEHMPFSLLFKANRELLEEGRI